MNLVIYKKNDTLLQTLKSATTPLKQTAPFPARNIQCHTRCKRTSIIF